MLSNRMLGKFLIDITKCMGGGGGGWIIEVQEHLLWVGFFLFMFHS